MFVSGIEGRENGPYLATGIARYLDADGSEQTTTGSTVAICCCGGSGNEPLWDGTDRTIDFQARAVELLVEDE